MAVLDKVYNCLTCGQQIKLERKPDGSGWLKWNLDMTKHVDVKKPKQSQQQQPQATSVDDGSQIVALTEEVKGLRETVKVLISQI